MKGLRGLEDIKTRRNTVVPSSMPDSKTSTYINLFTLEKEQEKLNKEMEILTKQIALLDRRMEEKRNHLREIDGQIAEVVKSESMRLNPDGTPQRANGTKKRLIVSHVRSKEVESEPEDAEKQWRTIKLEY